MEDYRISHTSLKYGEHYADAYRRPYKALSFSVEKRILDMIAAGLPGGRAASYLDFASGTGRIIGHMARHCGKSVGVDISEEMLAVAKKEVPEAVFYTGDISSDRQLHALLAGTGPFDLLTAFRFFLKAQHDLRISILRSLAPLLSEGGTFVFNIHKNRTSLLWMYRWLRKEAGRRPSESIQYGYMRRILRESGFEIKRVTGYMYMPYGLSLRMPGWWYKAELVLGRLPLLRHLGHSMIYEVRRRRGR
jgi:SAM-dependent methyltransferase